MVRYLIKIVPVFIVCSLLIVDTVSVCAAENTSEPAEVIGSIRDNNIPPIQVANWTKINLTIVDQTGIPWGLIEKNFKYLSKYVWPFIHPSWRRYLGYTSLTLQTEIIEGNSRGWYTKITPTFIPHTDAGITYNNITLYVKTDDIAVDYAVVVGVKVTRLDIYGNQAGNTTIAIPVKASALNNIKMNAVGPTTLNIAPHSYGSFNVNIQNFGYYKSMFRLIFANASDFYVSTPLEVIVLNPGDTQAVTINVLTPEKFYDIGTPHTINVFVTSTSDPTPKLIGSLVVITEGAYISPLIGIIAIPIIVIVLLVYLVFFYWRTKREKDRYGKPDKPWNIPEEKEHLRQLKKTDKKAYDEEKRLMEDEYQSAMLYYKDYRQSMKGTRVEEAPPKEEKPKRQLPKLLKKSETPKKPPKVEEKKVEAIVPAEDQAKQRALAKIQKEQEKALKRKRE